jgi:hypothetical protein
LSTPKAQEDHNKAVRQATKNRKDQEKQEGKEEPSGSLRVNRNEEHKPLTLSDIRNIRKSLGSSGSVSLSLLNIEQLTVKKSSRMDAVREDIPKNKSIELPRIFEPTSPLRHSYKSADKKSPSPQRNRRSIEPTSPPPPPPPLERINSEETLVEYSADNKTVYTSPRPERKEEIRAISPMKIVEDYNGVQKEEGRISICNIHGYSYFELNSRNGC